MTRRTRIAVLASGGGSNLQSLIDYFATRDDAGIVWVGSSRADAGALVRAREAGIASNVITDPTDGAALLSSLQSARVDLLVLAGYLKLVPASVVHAFRGRVINVHPALLPAFGGDGMYGRRVHEAVLAAGVSETGATVHFVDGEYDHGAVVARVRVPVKVGDTAADIETRVMAAEPRLFVDTLRRICSGELLAARA